jgi:hypothetical protein
MTSAEILVDAFGRVQETVHEVLRGLTSGQLAERLAPDANSIAWLVWHLTRIQDDHIAAVARLEQRWTADGWFERFGLPLDPHATGYGHGPMEVAALDGVPGELLLGYLEAVHHQTVRFVEGVGAEELDEVVDRSWDPPVTLGVRLVSVVADSLEHAGQAAYLRGLVERGGSRTRSRAP